MIKSNQLTFNTHNILIDNLETSNLFRNLELYSKYNINCFIFGDKCSGKSALTMHWARLISKNYTVDFTLNQLTSIESIKDKLTNRLLQTKLNK